MKCPKCGLVFDQWGSNLKRWMKGGAKCPACLNGGKLPPDAVRIRKVCIEARMTYLDLGEKANYCESRVRKIANGLAYNEDTAKRIADVAEKNCKGKKMTKWIENIDSPMVWAVMEEVNGRLQVCRAGSHPMIYVSQPMARAQMRRLKKEGLEWPTKKPDTDNIEKGVYDALNGLAYEDDKQIVMTNTVKVYGPEARVDVVIEELG